MVAGYVFGATPLVSTSRSTTSHLYLNLHLLICSCTRGPFFILIFYIFVILLKAFPFYLNLLLEFSFPRSIALLQRSIHRDVSLGRVFHFSRIIFSSISPSQSSIQQKLTFEWRLQASSSILTISNFPIKRNRQRTLNRKTFCKFFQRGPDSLGRLVSRWLFFNQLSFDDGAHLRQYCTQLNPSSCK